MRLGSPKSALAKPRAVLPGGLNVVVPSGPVSLQSRRARKSTFSQVLRDQLGTPQYFLSGEVSITVEWLIHERTRYETLIAPDVDNTLKVVLDTLCGPDGVLINDCQVQHVSCHWIDWTRPEQQLTVTIQHLPDDWIRKNELVFVKVARSLCWPLNLDLPAEVVERILTMLQQMVATNQRVLDLTGDWYATKRFVPIQQPFHSGRLRGFKVMSVEQVRMQLGLG